MGKQHLSDDAKRCIIELRKEGYSYSAIGERLGLVKSSVCLCVRQAKKISDGGIPSTKIQLDNIPLTSPACFLMSPATDRMMRRRVMESPSISAASGLGKVFIRTIQSRMQKHLLLRVAAPPPQAIAYGVDHIEMQPNEW